MNVFGLGSGRCGCGRRSRRRFGGNGLWNGALGLRVLLVGLLRPFRDKLVADRRFGFILVKEVVVIGFFRRSADGKHRDAQTRQGEISTNRVHVLRLLDNTKSPVKLHLNHFHGRIGRNEHGLVPHVLLAHFSGVHLADSQLRRMFCVCGVVEATKNHKFVIKIGSRQSFWHRLTFGYGFRGC